MKLLFVVVISIVTKRAELQSAVQDRIYFTDINGRVQALDRVSTEKTDVDVQKSVEVTSQVDQNYLQAISTPGYPNKVQNVRPDLHRVYLQVQPALFLNDPSYYGNLRVDDVAPFRTSGFVPLQGQAPPQGKPVQAPANIQPQREQPLNVNQQVKPIRPFNSQSVNNGNSEEINLNSGPKPTQSVQNPTTNIPMSGGNTPVSKAVTNFGLNLLRNIPTNSNVVVSPFSIVTLLALLQQGALGQTQHQITSALQMNPDYAVGAFKTFHDDIQKRTSRNILRLANNVFVADAFDLNKDFKSIAIRQFGSEVTPMKFYRSDAVDKINQWVASKTNNKIERLFAPDAVGENTQVVLVNAIYFKGLWATKFNAEATAPREFRYRDGSVRNVPFMHAKRTLRTGVDSELGSQVLVLPFENEQYSLMVVLPSAVSNVDALIATLTDERLLQYNTFNARDVIVYLPKFTARADVNLDPVFRKMGITNIFTQQAELSNLGLYRTHSPQVSTAVHSAMFSIDEDGATAAAATAISAVALSYDHESIVRFIADRPFLAVLWDNQAATPLFMAKIENPIG